MSELKCRHQIPPLHLMFFPFCEQDSHSQESPKTLRNLCWLFEVVVLCDEHFAEGFGGCHDDSFSVHKSQVADEAIVRYRVDPLDVSILQKSPRIMRY